MKKIHWLCPGIKQNDLLMLKNSNLASTRLRTSVACLYLKKNGYDVTFGDTINKDRDLIVIGKVGSDVKRFDYWMNQLLKCKNNGSQIYLDYTDNHLGFKSSMSQFYSSFIEVCDHIIVPSLKMKDNLFNYWEGPTTIIPDAIEVKIVPPRDKKSDTCNLLWFGHASNIEYIINLLENKSIINNKNFHLTVMSNLNGLELFKGSIKNKVQLENVTLLNWSKELMQSKALYADISLIPSSIIDPKKSGVSSNRLLTSLALGLPTLATNMPSYQAFSEYFLDIDKFSIEYMIENLKEQQSLVLKAQNELLDQFTEVSIGQSWLNLIKNTN